MGCFESVVEKPKSFRKRGKFYAVAISELSERSSFVRNCEGDIKDYYDFQDSLDGVHVFLVVDKRTQFLRAVKKVDKEQGKFNIEIEILRNLDHPNIIKIFEVFQDEQNYYFVSEYCQGDSLHKILQQNGTISERKAAQYLKQILCGVNYLHNAGVMHLDIKPENIVFQAKDSQSMLKILDFGTSEIRKKKIDLFEIVETCGYMPPEVLKGKASYKSDIWSCGVIMCEMLTGKNPFYGKRDEDTFLNIYGKDISFKSSMWEFISPQAKDLIQKMLHKNPKYRYNALDCINHYWFDLINPLQLSDIPYIEQILLNLANSFTNFNTSYDKLTQKVLTYMLTQTSQQSDIDELSRAFVALDFNLDGRLDQGELQDGFKVIFSDRKFDTQQIVQKCDLTGNGFIDLCEFLSATINWHDFCSNEKIVQLFNIYDYEGKGTITKEQMSSAMGVISEADWQSFVYDLNSDDEVTLSQFSDFIRKLIQKIDYVSFN